MSFDNTPIGMSDQPASPPPAAPLSGNEQMMAIASIVLGIIGLCASLFAGLCGAPFPIIGLILGYLAMKDPQQKTLAIIGIVISGLTLLIVCVLTIVLGGLMVMGPLIGNVFSTINSSLEMAP